MKDFFRGWRKKVGVLTLLMVCAISVVWIRSIYVSDSVSFTIGANKVIADSIDQSIEIRFFYQPGHDSAEKLFPWISTPVSELEPEHGLYHHPTPVWQVHGLGVAIGNWPIVRKLGYFTKTIVAPYYSITIPLTLISLWLLLSRPKASTQPKTAHPTATEGGGSTT